MLGWSVLIFFVDDENLDHVDDGCDKIGEYILCMFKILQTAENFYFIHICVLIKLGSDYANYYQGLWDCEAEGPDELAFQRGDLIYILSKVCVFSHLS